LPSDRFSYSRLQLFDQCLAKYRFIYLDGRPAGGESIESYLGGRLHEALEWLYREPRRRRGNILFDDLLNQYRSLWKEAWHGCVHIVQTDWQTDDYYQMGQRCLAGFYRRYAPFDEPVEGTERVISFTLDRDEGYLMTAVLDRLDQHGPGWWSIHDYKSGKRIITAAQAEKDLQMKVYYLALVKTLENAERVDVVWHFLRHGREVILENVVWNPQRITTMLSKRIDRIKEREAQPQTLRPRESPLCNWCYYWDVCPAMTGQTHPARLAG
jgi:putative RecB family exonuclease